MTTQLLALPALALLAFGARAEPATYAIEPNHTFVTFEALHYGTSTVRGRFDKKSGTVQFDRAAKAGKVELTLDMASIDTGIKAFDVKLSGPDFFQTDAFPTASFVGDKFSFEGDKVSAVAGTLTLLGKSQPVVLKADNFNCYQNPVIKREVCGGNFDFTIQRSSFGMDYGLPKLPDTVRLVVQVEAIKQQ